MSALHDDEVALDDDAVAQLVADQFPQWAGLPLRPAGHGTDNRMLRLGEELLVRLPRTPRTAADVAKEQTWLPVLGPKLPLIVPEPVGQGRPDGAYPFPWSVYRWIDGQELDPDAVAEPARLGRDLAGFVHALHGVDLEDARRQGPLKNYRGGRLDDLATDVADDLAACRELPLDLDLDRLAQIWRDATDLAEPSVQHVWMHTDLRPTNLVVRDDVLVGVIDFGGLSIGNPTGEHAATWDLPTDARLAYADELHLDRDTRLRARGWALAIALSGVPYYWSSWPDFVELCLRRLRAILTAAV